MMPGRFPRCWLPLALAAAGRCGWRADARAETGAHVTDLTGTLTAQQVDQLDAQLVALEKAKGAQLVVLVVGSTGDQDIDGPIRCRVADGEKIGRSAPATALLIARREERPPRAHRSPPRRWKARCPTWPRG